MGKRPIWDSFDVFHVERLRFSAEFHVVPRGTRTASKQVIKVEFLNIEQSSSQIDPWLCKGEQLAIAAGQRDHFEPGERRNECRFEALQLAFGGH